MCPGRISKKLRAVSGVIYQEIEICEWFSQASYQAWLKECCWCATPPQRSIAISLLLSTLLSHLSSVSLLPHSQYHIEAHLSASFSGSFFLWWMLRRHWLIWRSSFAPGLDSFISVARMLAWLLYSTQHFSQALFNNPGGFIWPDVYRLKALRSPNKLTAGLMPMGKKEISKIYNKYKNSGHSMV